VNTQDIYSNIFLMQQQYLNDSEQKKITDSHIALAGVGGIGGYVLESLIRNGFSNFRMSDCDAYEFSNYRQLYMTLNTIGVSKVEAAISRIQSINPCCSIAKFPEGIRPSNARQFCGGADVILQETDSISALLVLKYWASQLRLPYLHGSRKHWLQSRSLTVAFEDYRDSANTFEYDCEGISSRYGISEKLLQEFFICIETETDNLELEKQMQLENAAFRRKTLQKFVDEQDIDAIVNFTGGKGIEHIKSVIDKYPGKFDKMRIAPEQAMLMGALVTGAVKDIVLGKEVKTPLVTL